MSRLSLGIDLGTSGVRSAVVDEDGVVLSAARAAYPPFDPALIDAEAWWQAAAACLEAQLAELEAAGRPRDEVAHIAVDGTSGSVVLTDATLRPVTRGLLYRDGGFDAEARCIAAVAPDQHVARGAGSALARALRLVREDTDGRARHLLHQADFVTAKLMGCGGRSDTNNALKTGYDPATGTWPGWIDLTGLPPFLLPEVALPGTSLALVASDIADRFGLARDVTIHAGTTDSIGAFLAAARMEPGAAVTSLGTTLAIKILTTDRIDRPEIGLYSHRIGSGWLVGGASNTGGGALLRHFAPDEIASLSERIDPRVASDLDYYPLPCPGERFPVPDPEMPSREAPRPPDDVAFLHGLLEGIARVEAACYDAVAALGGPRPRAILTAGGGAENETWRAIRERVLNISVRPASETEAAVGTARLPFLAGG